MKNLKPNALSEEKLELSESGNPGMPQGESGEAILERMNISHYDFTSWALEHIQIPSFGKIIDIGCGGGITLKRLSKESAEGKLFGLDYSDVAVSKTREVNEDDIRAGKMQVLKASLEKIPFESDVFDLVTSFETFYFWPNHAENLKEIRRIMRSGAKFLLASESFEHEGLSDEIRQKLKERGIYNHSYDEYDSYFKKAGFSKYEIFTKDNWIGIVAEK